MGCSTVWAMATSSAHPCRRLRSARGPQATRRPVSSAHGTAKGQPALCPWIPRARAIGATRRSPRRRPVGAWRAWSAARVGSESSRGTRKIARSISCSSVSAARQGALSRSSRSRRARVARRRSSNLFIKFRCRSSIGYPPYKRFNDPQGPQVTMRAPSGQPAPPDMAARSRGLPFPLRERGDREAASVPCYPLPVLCGWSCEAGVPVP